MSKHNLEELVQEVEKSFRNTPYPGDEQIGIEEFIGRDWRTLPLKMSLRCRFDHGYLAPAAYRYFLPAFLLAALRHTSKVDSLPNNIIYGLAPPESYDEASGPSEETRKFFRKAKVFSPEEKATIRLFVEGFKEFFPNGDWSELQSEYERLERAIEFWTSITE